MDKRNTVLLKHLKTRKGFRYTLELLKFILVAPFYSRTTELTSKLTTLRGPLQKPPVGMDGWRGLEPHPSP